MKFNQSIVIIIFISFMNFGCKVFDKKNDSTVRTLIASCEIENILFEQLECIEFYEGLTQESEDLCDQAQDRHLASIKHHKDRNSARRCLSSNRIAQCLLPFYTISFYEDGYTAGEAQTECNSLEGTFEE